MDNKTQKFVLRKLFIKWHPDKFPARRAKWKGDDTHWKKVLEKVHYYSTLLTKWKEYKDMKEEERLKNKKNL